MIRGNGRENFIEIWMRGGEDAKAGKNGKKD
jgi:hypothetical protein